MLDRGASLRAGGLPAASARVASAEFDRSRGGPVAAAADAEVQELDEDGEAHREVDVALGDVLVEAFEEQREADQEQEAQGQHL